MNNQKPLKDVVSKRLLRNAAIALIVVIVFFCFPNLVTGDCGHDHGDGHHHHHHHHEHDHIEEPASFKWSRAANEKVSHEHEHEHHTEETNKVAPG